MTNVTKDNFDELVINSKIPTIIDFWAEWCGPCRMVAPIFESLSEEQPKIQFLKCNVDETPELAQRFGIRGIPSFLFFNNGNLISVETGAMNKSAFAEKIKTRFPNL